MNGPTRRTVVEHRVGNFLASETLTVLSLLSLPPQRYAHYDSKDKCQVTRRDQYTGGWSDVTSDPISSVTRSTPTLNFVYHVN